MLDLIDANLPSTEKLPDTAPLVEKKPTTQQLLEWGDVVVTPTSIVESITNAAPMKLRGIIKHCTIEEDSTVKMGELYLDVEKLRNCIATLAPRQDRKNIAYDKRNLKTVVYFYDRIRQVGLKDPASVLEAEAWREIRDELEALLKQFISTYPQLISSIKNPDTAILLSGTGVINAVNEYKEHQELDSQSLHTVVLLTKKLLKSCLNEDSDVSDLKISFALSIITWLQSESIIDEVGRMDSKLVQFLRSKVLTNLLLTKLEGLTFAGLDPEEVGYTSVSHNIAHTLNNIVLRKYQLTRQSEEQFSYEREQAIAFGVKGLIEYNLRKHLTTTSIIPELIDELNKATNSNLGDTFWQYVSKKNRTVITPIIEDVESESGMEAEGDDFTEV